MRKKKQSKTQIKERREFGPDFFEAKVVKQGNDAAIPFPKKFIGREVYIMLLEPKGKKKQKEFDDSKLSDNERLARLDFLDMTEPYYMNSEVVFIGPGIDRNDPDVKELVKKSKKVVFLRGKRKK